MKFRPWEIFLSLLLIGIFGSAGYLFFVDLTQNNSQGKGEPIGTVTFRKNTAQRKFSDRVIWQELPEKSFVYNNDSIRTLSDAQAVLNLDGGTEIVLEDNSLVTLQWAKKTIDFQGGNISATRSGDLALGTAEVLIRSRSAVVSLDKATVQVTQSKDGNVGVVVSEGEARVKVGEKTQTLDVKKQGTIRNDDKGMDVEIIPIGLRAPLTNSFFITSKDSLETDFSWILPPNWKSGNLEVSPLADFSNSKKVSIDKITQTKLSLELGTWFWKIRGQGDEGTELVSGTRKFTILGDGIISLNSPENEAQFRYNNELPLLRFSWSESNVAIGYEFQIASDKEMKTRVVQQRSDTPQYSTRTLTQGTYWWRVKPIYSAIGSDLMPTSDPKSFTITKFQNAVPPEILLPKNGEKIFTEDATEKGINIIWQGEDGGAGFEAVLSSSADLKNLVGRLETTGNTVRFPGQLSPGTYYFRVAIKEAEGRAGAVSEVRTIILEDPLPGTVLTGPEDGEIGEWNPLSGLSFSWRSSRGRFFLLEVSRDTSFANPVIVQKTSQYTLNLPKLDSGEWYWRIKEQDKTGAVVFITKPWKLILVPPMAKPSIQSPTPASVLALSPGGNIDLRWQPVPGALSYDLQIFKEGRLLEEKMKLDTNRVILKREPSWTSGDYSWTVRAQGPLLGKTGIFQSSSSGSSFSVVDAPVFVEPELIYPRQAQVVAGLENLRTGIVFQWKITPPLSKSVLSVYKEGNGNEPLYKLTTDQMKAPLAGLSAGKYFWKIETLTSGGQSGPSSKDFEFTVGEIPPLALPTPVFPIEAQTVDMTEAVSLSLRWQGVLGAGFYEVKLFKKGDPKPRFASSGIRALEVIFQDLASLDVGDFYWTIQAFNVDAKGAVFQKSALRLVNFKITLKESDGTVNITSPEVQYAP